MRTRQFASTAFFTGVLAVCAVLGVVRNADAAGFQLVVPVDTSALSAKGYLPGWLAIDVKCDLFPYAPAGSMTIPGKIGSGVALHVPATAGTAGADQTMVKVVATENTAGAALHATYSCTAGVESIAGHFPLSTKAVPVKGPIEQTVTTTAPVVLTLLGSNLPPAKFGPPRAQPALGASPHPMQTAPPMIFMTPMPKPSPG